jgi:heat shock protein HslJ
MKKVLLWLIIPLAVLLLVGCDQLGQEEPELKTVYVASERVDCEGEGPQTCYLVKENTENDWGLWYFDIEGLDYEPGYEYELVVAENQVENPPAGGSSITWSVQEVVSKTPVAGGDTGETGEADPTGTETGSAEEPPVQLSFEPIVVEDLGLTTVAPADWPRIEGDPLLRDAWGPGQYNFVAFHAVPGDDVQAAMAQLLSTTPEQLAGGSVEGDYWEEQIGSYAWGMYSIDKPDVGLMQTVSMTEQDGTVYVVSLFVETEQKDTILLPVLENFAIMTDPQSAEIDTAEGQETGAETGEESLVESTDLTNTRWLLTMFDDGTGQFLDVLPGVEITALFAEDGRVSGSAGCNDYVSLFSVDGDDLSISLPAMTRRDCAELDGMMLHETSYLGNLTSVAAYELQDNTLHLSNEAGQVVLIYQAP